MLCNAAAAAMREGGEMKRERREKGTGEEGKRCGVMLCNAAAAAMREGGEMKRKGEKNEVSLFFIDSFSLSLCLFFYCVFLLFFLKHII